MPAGARAYKVEVAGDKTVRAMAVEKDGRYMLAVVNVSKEERPVLLKSSSLPELSGVKEFVYAEGRLLTEGDCRLLPVREALTLSLKSGESLEMPAQSLVVYTNFDY